MVDDLREAVAAAAADVERLDLGSVSLDHFKGWPESLIAFFENLSLLRRSFVEDPPDLFLENLRLRTLIEPLAAGRFPGHYRLANLDRFFRDLGEMLSGGATAAAILRRLRQAERERPDEESGRPRSDAHGVRVLTIHGAKGLGFSHVWVVQTFACGRAGTSNRSAAVHEGGRWEMTLQGMASPGYLEVERWGERVEEAERVRLLYVALTRARRRLVTVGNSLPAAGGKGPIGKLLEKRTEVWLSAGEGWGGGAVGPRIDRDEAQWVWLGHPDLEANAPGSGLVHAAEGSVAPSRVAEDAQLLQRWKKEAGERQARPWLERATDEAHRQARDALGARLEGVDEAPAVGGEDGIDRRVATAVGTAVHAMLERFDMEADDPVAELENQSVNAASWLRVFLGSGESSDRGLARLEKLVKGFRSGALWQALLALRGHVLARELPLVAPPEPGGAVGAVTGAIDLVYRDPVTDELVIADFKTDRVESEREIADRKAAYAHQLEIYARAVEAALKLEVSPRRELWFLHPGRIVVVE